MYFNRNRTFSGSFEAYGGKSGGSGASVGGAGTIFLYHKGYQHRTLQISNEGAGPITSSLEVINDWNNHRSDASKSWIITDSNHKFAKGLNYHFEELQLRGAAHLAFYSAGSSDKVFLYFHHMIGDRTGTLHVGPNHTMDLDRPEIDLPFNVRVYQNGHIGLSPMTFVHGIKIHNSGLITRMVNITLHHGGELYFYEGSRVGNNSLPDDYLFNTIRIQAGGLVKFVSSPATHSGMNLTTALTYIEGGGKLMANDIRVLSQKVVVDSGGHFSADGLGYTMSHGTGRKYDTLLYRLDFSSSQHLKDINCFTKCLFQMITSGLLTYFEG